MKARKVLLLHIGTHKTGTSSLQAAFAACELEFAASGVLYPKSGRIGDGHHNIAWGLSADERFDPAFGYLEELGAELRSAGSSTALLSSEDFEYLYKRPDDLSRLKRSIEDSGYETRVALVLRDPREYAESLFFELTQHGLVEEHDHFVAHALADGGVVFKPNWDFRLDYVQLIDGFAEVFGRESITVLQYDAQDMVSSFVHQFHDLLGDAGDQLPTDLRRNVSHRGASSWQVIGRASPGQDLEAPWSPAQA